MVQVQSARRPAAREDDRRPDFIARAPDPQRRGRWLTVGAAWKRDDAGYKVKLNTVPVGQWDGALVLLPPFEDEQPEDNNQDRGDDFSR